MPCPSSHRVLEHARSCSNCKFSTRVSPFRDLLCFHGDAITVIGVTEYPVKTEIVEINGKDISSMDGEEYSDVWGPRAVDRDEVCDEWQAKS